MRRPMSAAPYACTDPLEQHGSRPTPRLPWHPTPHWVLPFSVTLPAPGSTSRTRRNRKRGRGEGQAGA